MKKYKEFIVTSAPFNSEILSGILWELDITGIDEEENYLRVFADARSELDSDTILSQLKKLQTEKLIDEFNVEESLLEEKNWNEEWEKSLNVIKAADRIIIKPSSRSYEKQDDEIIITIDPKMSFGTGEHQTTRLIIGMLEKYIRPGMKILDAGTGTGILSIAAVKLGALNAIGFDTDEWCFENALENCISNNVKEKIDIRAGDVSVIYESDFDVILANIQKSTLIELSGEFLKRLKKEGIILLSGLLEDDEPDIIREYASAGAAHLETRQLDEWVALAFIRS